MTARGKERGRLPCALQDVGQHPSLYLPDANSTSLVPANPHRPSKLWYQKWTNVSCGVNHPWLRITGLIWVFLARFFFFLSFFLSDTSSIVSILFNFIVDLKYAQHIAQETYYLRQWLTPKWKQYLDKAHLFQVIFKVDWSIFSSLMKLPRKLISILLGWFSLLVSFK